MSDILQESFQKLIEQFDAVTGQDDSYAVTTENELKSIWPEQGDDEIMVHVYEGDKRMEPFHRHDYFFFDYAYRNNHQSISDFDGNLITIHENECYIGQPFSGHAIRSIQGEDAVIIGIRIKRDAFIKHFLPALSKDFYLFHFFLDPDKDEHLDGYIHLAFEDPTVIRMLLEMIVIEYAHSKEDTQSILRSMLTTLLMYVSRVYRDNMKKGPKRPLVYKILEYIYTHLDTATLRSTAECFAYHPNYLSNLLHAEMGKTFSEIILSSRMERAALFLQNTELSIDDIALMIGYKSSASFYRAFKRYYGVSPREYK